MLFYKKYLVLITLSYCFIQNSVAADMTNAWPKVKTYNESDCLILEKDKTLINASSKVEQFTIYSKFLLGNADGEIYTNPVVKKGLGTLTFSLEKNTKASFKESSKYIDCYKRIDLQIGADSKLYDKLYIVIDKVVMYEFDLQ